jgi:hypothetical protein
LLRPTAHRPRTQRRRARLTCDILAS